MTWTELDAAGITAPALRSAYTTCRTVNARHGRTYFLATRLLPPSARPAVHALYGFARLADDIVDGTASTAAKSTALAALERDLVEVLTVDVGAHLDLVTKAEAAAGVLLALADTASRYGIAHELFTDFLASMRMDLHVTDYATFDDLAKYTHGSAEVIGLQLLPVLGVDDAYTDLARPYAAALGNAFQLTNFLRDIGEDLDRDRVYLPADELAAFGVDRDRLRWAWHSGRPDRAVRNAIAHLVAYTYAGYRAAEPGIALLHPQSRPCVATAATLYRGILDRIVAADYDVLRRRVAVPGTRRLGVALFGLVRAVAARNR